MRKCITKTFKNHNRLRQYHKHDLRINLVNSPNNKVEPTTYVIKKYPSHLHDSL